MHRIRGGGLEQSPLRKSARRMEAMFSLPRQRRESTTALAPKPMIADDRRTNGDRGPGPGNSMLSGIGRRADELQGSRREQREGDMPGRLQVFLSCTICLAGAFIWGSAAMAQETIVAPDGRCVVSYDDRQPTVDERKRALELGDGFLARSCASNEPC